MAHLSHRTRLTAIVASLVLAAFPLAASAAGPYAGETGFDISYPQCSANSLPDGTFGVVGVTGGKAFTQNGCFATEYDRTLSKTTSVTSTAGQVALYMNLNAAIGSTATEGATGPKGSCARSDKACFNYNYGYNAAGAALSYAASRASASWWLDIETANSWNNNQPTLNRAVIQGAVDRLEATGITNVGIYSTPSMWNTITGNWNNGLPVWYAGAGCSAAVPFTGGPVWLAQQASASSNGDQGC